MNRLSLVLGSSVLLLLATGCRPVANPRDSGRPDAQPALNEVGEHKAPKTIYDGVNILPEGPHIRLKDGAGAVVEVVGIDAKELAALQEAKLKPDDWPSQFALYVQREGKDVPGQTPVGGTYRIVDGSVQFEPRFPLMRGVHYRALFQRPDANALATVLFLPKPNLPPTVVEHIYPTRDDLPENQLKFYLHFSAPMSRGEAYENVRLLDAGGQPVAQPFLELDQELWDADCKRFTLFFDPGRIKRGLKPRADLGPALEEGKRYTLVIDRNWNDANGEPLKETYKKSFRVLAPDDTQPDPKAWQLAAPAANGVTPLTVTFPKSLEFALANRLLWVVDRDGHKVAGSVAVTQQETRWQFTPKGPWAAGTYNLVADTRLEDLAGNSIAKPFEVDVFHPVQKEIQTETVPISFEVR